MNTPNKSQAVGTKRAIINLLKREGLMDAEALAERLQITGMAVRQHLYGLQKEHLVTYQEELRPMGRPAKLWQLTPEANRLFPDRYAELTLSLINSITEAFGEEGVEKFLEIKTRKQITDYQKMIPEASSLQQRLEILAAIRTDEGYMAEIQPQEEEGCFLLIENHCPICTVAVSCTGLCRHELEVFQAVLGQNVAIERTEHIVAGERRCVYQVRAAVP
jgi:iron-sulfur cluster biosynthesis transcriptional regulator SufR